MKRQRYKKTAVASGDGRVGGERVLENNSHICGKVNYVWK
jgi:hypothetical protein